MYSHQRIRILDVPEYPELAGCYGTVDEYGLQLAATPEMKQCAIGFKGGVHVDDKGYYYIREFVMELSGNLVQGTD